MQQDKTLLVISHYAERSKAPLEALVHSMRDLNSDLTIVINSDQVTDIRSSLWSPGIDVITRPNTGMNIGGWDCAYRQHPGYGHYIFLQDECILKNADFLSFYEMQLARPDIGMIGESINFKWDRSWGVIASSGLNYIVGRNDAGRQITRVEYYLERMSHWGVSPGSSGRHLRALIWAFPGHVLRQINGFPVGFWKEECIAAEISVSKAVEQLGLRVEQVDEKPFKFFGHTEWQEDGSGKIPP